MPIKRNILTEAVLEVGAELKAFSTPVKDRPPAFMEERVPAREEATAVKNMSRNQKLKWIDDNGVEKMREVAGRLVRRDNA